MVSVLAFNSDDPSENPAGVNNFFVKFVFEITKINLKRPGLAQLKKFLRNRSLEQL